MPSPTLILDGLMQIANQVFALAIVWHLAMAGVIVALVLGWRPSRQSAGLLLVVPMLSVSTLGVWFGNVFNGLVFLAAAIAMALMASRFGREAAGPGPAWARFLGWLLVAFAWIYPHFLERADWLTYLAAAPVGLIPCPTLSLVIGFTLIAGGFSSRTWSLTLAVLGLFYGLFGVLRLGVWLDLGLLTGAAGLLLLGVLPGIQNQTRPAPKPMGASVPIGEDFAAPVHPVKTPPQPSAPDAAPKGGPESPRPRRELKASPPRPDSSGSLGGKGRGPKR